jgi:hypothetical protein
MKGETYRRSNKKRLFSYLHPVFSTLGAPGPTLDMWADSRHSHREQEYHTEQVGSEVFLVVVGSY